MRDIKFRAWNEVEEKMLNWYEFLDTNMKNTFIAPESTGLILMQYTGLKDKNGKEIYEGDVIKYPEYWIGDTHFPKGISVIYWDDEEACFDTYTNTSLFDLIKNLKCEVEGNIYDNPELLEEGK